MVVGGKGLHLVGEGEVAGGGVRGIIGGLGGGNKGVRAELKEEIYFFKA